MWRIGLALALMTIFVVAALLNLGLVSIPGSGLAVARYQAAEVMAVANE